MKDDAHRQDAALVKPAYAAVRRGMVVAVCVFLTVPMVSKALHWPPDVRLIGAEERLHMPGFRWADWFAGAYQREVEAYMAQRTGLRGFFIKLLNQSNYSLFGKLSGGGGTMCSEGKDSWLYEDGYINEYVSPTAMGPDRVEMFSKRLGSLQYTLNEAGIEFLLVVAPSKAQVYPEQLPDSVGIGKRPTHGTSAYEALMPALAAENVRCVDAHRLFLDLKTNHPALFAPGGTHWNYYGAQIVAHESMKRIESETALRFPVVPEIERIQWQQPVGTDVDLRNLLNLWRFEPHGMADVPYPVMKSVTRREGAPKVKAVIVGDSFGYTLVDALARTEAFDRIEFLYYFKRRFSYDLSKHPRGAAWVLPHVRFEVGPFDKDTLDWDATLADAKLVIIEINEILLINEGWRSPEIISRVVRDRGK